MTQKLISFRRVNLLSNRNTQILQSAALRLLFKCGTGEVPVTLENCHHWLTLTENDNNTLFEIYHERYLSVSSS